MKNFKGKYGFSAGLNLLAQPRALANNELARATNVVTTPDGLSLKKRPSVVASLEFRQLLKGTQVFTRNLRLLQAANPVTSQRLILQSVFSTAYPVRITALPSEAYFDTGTTEDVCAYRGSFEQYQSVHNVVLGGQFEGFVDLVSDPSATGGCRFRRSSFAVRTPGTGPLGLGQTQQIAVCPNLNAKYRSRMVYGNFGPGMENWIVFSDWDNPNHNFAPNPSYPELDYYPMWMVVGSDVLSANGRHIPIDAFAGEPLVGMQETMMNELGTPIQTSLLLLSTTRAAFLVGEPSQSYETDDRAAAKDETVAINKVNYAVGCASKETLANSKFGLYWASGDEVWWLPRGAQPIAIGTKISPALKAIPQGFHQRWWAAVHDGFYKLFVSDGDLAANGTSNPYPLPSWRSFWLDLRSGPPADAGAARWTEHSYSTICPGPPCLSTEAVTGFASFGAGDVLDDRLLAGADGAWKIPDGGGSFFDGANIVELSGGQDGNDRAMPTVRNAQRWQPNTAYSVGDVVKPPDYDIVRDVGIPTEGPWGCWWVCYLAGTSANTLVVPVPDWLQPAGYSGADTVIDGSVTWVILGADEYRSPGGVEITKQTVPNRFCSAGAAEEEAGIRGEVLFKDDGFGEPALEKGFGSAVLTARSEKVKELFLDVVVNQGEDGFPISKDWPVSDEDKQNTLGVVTLDSSPLSEALQARSYEMPDGARLLFRHLQLGLRDDGEFVIDETNDKLMLGIAWTPNIPVLAAWQLRTVEAGAQVGLKYVVVDLSILRGHHGDPITILSSIAELIRSTLQTAFPSVSWLMYPNGALPFRNPYHCAPWFGVLAVYNATWASSQGQNLCFLFDDGSGTDAMLAYGASTKKLLAQLGFDTAVGDSALVPAGSDSGIPPTTGVFGLPFGAYVAGQPGHNPISTDTTTNGAKFLTSLESLDIYDFVGLEVAAPVTVQGKLYEAKPFRNRSR